MTHKEYPLIHTNLSGQAAGAAISLPAAAEAVLAADTSTGRIHHEQSLVIRIPSPRRSAFAYYFHGVLNRSGRPQHPPTCPLCLAAVRASGQHFAALDLPEGPVLALANPYPYLPECVTWAILDHLPQACGHDADWHRVFLLMLRICAALPGQVVGFNDIAGNSLDHRHLVSHRPNDGHGLYAPQALARHRGLNEGTAHLGPYNGYPTDVWRICGTRAARIADGAVRLIRRWRKEQAGASSANAACVIEEGRLTLYLFARNPLLSAWGWGGKPAILEMMGVFIASTPEAIAEVQRGAWGHDHFSAVLASLCPTRPTR